MSNNNSNSEKGIIMQDRLKTLLGLGASFAVVFSVHAYSCVVGEHPQNCHTLGNPCTTYNAPGCVNQAVEGYITVIGINNAITGYAGPGQGGNDGSSTLKPCVATCSSTWDCYGYANSGTVSMNYNYWWVSAETCTG